MSDWTVADLQKWDDKICRVGEDFGLDWFPIDYEIIDYARNAWSHGLYRSSNALSALVLRKRVRAHAYTLQYGTNRASI